MKINAIYMRKMVIVQSFRSGKQGAVSELMRDALTNNKWILAYEAEYHSFLPLKNISSDPFFSILKKNKISFYDNSIILPKKLLAKKKDLQYPYQLLRKSQ